MSFGRSNNFPDYGATNSMLGGRSNPGPQPNSNFDIATYHQLCDNISCNIFSINNNVTALEKASKEIGTQSDSPLLRNKIHSTQQNTKNLVSNTTKFLKELTVIVTKGGREHRLQSERVRNEFHATVQRYDTLQKQLGPKMKRAELPLPSSSKNIWALEEEEEQQSLLDADRVQQQQKMEEELEFEKIM
ncbi:t-SNARE domain-containing protein 1-like [Uloborus diversus]|uniref:t-SNARE domain-containing protein 1-like n=1 Tax=Uloborus diversus TaxID=327109 RepID=UPI00240A8716|nr:t-SNARE domain-containing protein 1-like [Uloborus diversus]